RCGGVEPPLVHVAQRDDVLVAERSEIVAAASADTDAGDVQFFTGRRPAACRDCMARRNGERGKGCAGSTDESSPGDWFHIITHKMPSIRACRRELSADSIPERAMAANREFRLVK